MDNVEGGKALRVDPCEELLLFPLVLNQSQLSGKTRYPKYTTHKVSSSASLFVLGSFFFFFVPLLCTEKPFLRWAGIPTALRRKGADGARFFF